MPPNRGFSPSRPLIRPRWFAMTPSVIPSIRASPQIISFAMPSWNSSISPLSRIARSTACMSYDMHAVLRAILDNGEIDEFQDGIAKEMICGDARIDGITLGVIANQRGLIKGREGEKPRFGGIVYTESAEKVAYFIDRCDRLGIPLLFVQDVSGFMVGTEAEHAGIIRAGARFVEAMATARVPK